MIPTYKLDSEILKSPQLNLSKNEFEEILEEENEDYSEKLPLLVKQSSREETKIIENYIGMRNRRKSKLTFTHSTIPEAALEDDERQSGNTSRNNSKNDPNSFEKRIMEE